MQPQVFCPTKQMLRTLLLLPCLLLCLDNDAFSQQGDSCATPIAIAGTGSFAFDTSNHFESDFEMGSWCSPFIGEFTADIFFAWTVPTTGNYQIDTQGTSWDEMLNVYSGTDCNATCLSPSLTTGNGFNFCMTRFLNLNAGDQLLIQVGGQFAQDRGTGFLNISPWVNPCDSYPVDAFEPNQNCASASTLSPGLYNGLTTFIGNSDWYSVTIPAGMILNWNEVSDSDDCTYDLYDETCTIRHLEDETTGFAYTNVTGAPETVKIHAYPYAHTLLDPQCSEYSIDLGFTPDPCQLGTDDYFEDNDECGMPAGPQNGTHVGLFVSETDLDFYHFCIANGAALNVDLLFDHQNGNLFCALYDAFELDCSTSTNPLVFVDTQSDDETLTWVNTSGGPVEVIFKVGMAWGECNSYDMSVQGAGCGNLGVPFCNPMNVNSTGLDTRLSGVPSTTSETGLTLRANGPHGQFAYLLVGTAPNAPGIPISEGRLCLAFGQGNTVGRYNTQGSQNSLGQFDNITGEFIPLLSPSGTGNGFDVPSTLPFTGSPTIAAGSTWHFQLWHRDLGGASNFSNGLSVHFP